VNRIYGEGAEEIRYLITSDILLHMVNEIRNDEEGVNVRPALCMDFAAFLRAGELTWNTWSPDSHCFLLSRDHVGFHSTSVTLTLPVSKTDQFRVGAEIYLAYSPNSSLYPVQLSVLSSLAPTVPTIYPPLWPIVL